MTTLWALGAVDTAGRPVFRAVTLPDLGPLPSTSTPRTLTSGPPRPRPAFATAIPAIDGPTTTAPQAIAQPTAPRINGPFMAFRFRSSVYRQLALLGYPLFAGTTPGYWDLRSQQHAGRYRRLQCLLQVARLAIPGVGADEGESGYPRDAGQRGDEKVSRAGGPQVLVI